MHKPLPIPKIKLDKLFVLVAALLLALPAMAQRFAPLPGAFVTNGVVLFNFWGGNLGVGPGGTLGNGLPACDLALQEDDVLGVPSASYYTNMVLGAVNDGINNYEQQWVGVFIPSVTTNYTFFVCSDDYSELYLSTDITAANRRVVAAEQGWSNSGQWIDSAGGSPTGQKRSDKYIPPKGTTAPYANGIPLVAGNMYYFTYIQEQGGGGDNAGVTFKFAGGADPVDGDAPLILPSNLAFVLEPPTSVTISQNPSNTTVFDGELATFTVGGIVESNNNPLYLDVFQWQRNGVNITNTDGTSAIGSSYSFIARTNDDGAQFRAVATFPVPGGVTNSYTSASGTLHVVPGVITLGGLKRDYWTNVSSIGQLAAGNVPGPSLVTALSSFETAINDNIDNYGEKVSGFFIPPVSTNYTFFVNSDDQSDLYISTDANPDNKYLIAQEPVWANTREWTGDQGDDTGATGTPGQKRSDQWTNSLGIAPYSNGIPLVAGNMYYIEGDHFQGGGGDNFAATYIYVGAPDPQEPTAGPPATPGDAPAFSAGTNGTNIAYISGPVTKLTLTAAPLDATVFQGDVVTFVAAAASDSEFSPVFQWTKFGTNIPGASVATVNIPGGAQSTLKFPTLKTDNGDTIQCAITLPNSPLTTNTTAHLTVQQAQVVQGFLKLEYWSNQSGRGGVEAGTAGDPDYTTAFPGFESFTGSNDRVNFVERMSGYFTPTVTTNYTFYIATDDDSDLFISTDDNPANKYLIAQEPDWAGSREWGVDQGNGANDSQTESDTWSPTGAGGASVPYANGIALKAGTNYYIEAVHHQGGGGYDLGVTYRYTPGGTPPNVGDAPAFLSTEISMLAPLAHLFVTNLPAPTTVTAGTTASFSALAGSDSAVSIGGNTNIFVAYQWVFNGTNVSGATLPSFTTGLLTTNQSGETVSCAISAIGAGTSNTPPVALTVVGDSVPPAVAFAASVSVGGNATPNIDITFNKPMDVTSLTNPANYTITGVTVTGANLISVGGSLTTVELTLSKAPTGSSFSVSISGVKSFSGVPVAASTAATGTMFTALTSVDIGMGVGTDPVIAGDFVQTGPNSYDVTASGSDIWNNNDAYQFDYEPKTNSFDVVVQVTHIDAADTWTKAGLSAREAIDTTDGGSRRVFCISTAAAGQTTLDAGAPENSISLGIRDTLDGASADPPGYIGDGVIAPQYPNQWVRITRTTDVGTGGTNDSFGFYCSTDGVTWTNLVPGGWNPSSSGDSKPFASVIYVGISTTAHIATTATDPTLLGHASYQGYNSSYTAAPPLPSLTTSVSGTHLTISWSPTGGNLYSSPVLGSGAVWTKIGSANPAMVTISATGNQYYGVGP